MFETSLWDLKLSFTSSSKIIAHAFETSLWDLKLYDAIKEAISQYVRNLPMGFETRLRESFPYFLPKFETSLWDLKLVCFSPDLSGVVAFETSLWDLKLDFVNHIKIFKFVRNLPMGFETNDIQIL